MIDSKSLGHPLVARERPSHGRDVHTTASASPDTGLRLSEIWRYPVKSLRGERLEGVSITADGITGDRRVHVRGSRGLLTGRTRYGLLSLAAHTGEDGVPRVEGHRWDSREAAEYVAEAAGRDAQLVWHGGRHRFDVLPLLVATDSEIASLGVDGQRLRPNLVVSGTREGAEREWPGMGLRVGDALIGVHSLRPRCIVTTIDPETGAQDLEVLRRIRNEFDGSMALNCWVIRQGVVRQGDPVDVIALPDPLPPNAAPQPGGWVTGEEYP